MKAGDREKLWDKYKVNPSQELREQLILEYAPLVKIVAGRLCMYLGNTVEYEDLCSYGIFGLIDAIDKYGSDKPDLRFEMEIQDITDIFLNTEFTVFQNVIRDNGIINAIVIKNASEKYSRKDLDKLTDFVTADTLSNYQQKVYAASNLTTTSPALALTASNRNSIYQYSNVLNSLTITVPTTPINLDQSIRLIFKATSSTTITVPSGLYFRGDDCNDSYVFIPQDNKVYDIIITYDGFNYNGIVVGTPATR